MTRVRPGEAPSVALAIEKMVAEGKFPPEAEADVALAMQTAVRVDAGPHFDGYAPVANAMMKQLAVLRTWMKPTDVGQPEDPFDALARSLSSGAAQGGEGDAV